MNKVVASAAEAVADIPDGASVAVVGFNLAHRFPSSLILAFGERDVKDITLVCNSLGRMGHALSKIIEGRRVRHLIASFTGRAGAGRSSAEEQIAAGTMTFELVAQGTLVERLRAGGAGIAGFYTRTGVGTKIAEGKDVRTFDGKDYLFERALSVDYAFVRAYRADTMGNLEFRGGSQTFSPSFAKGARVAIAEVDEIVEPGGIPPERVGLPGVFVARVVKTEIPYDLGKLIEANKDWKRPGTAARIYNGKPALTRADIAARAARLLPEGSSVNLGSGIPGLVCNYVAGRDIMLHTENGILGYGEVIEGDDIDPDNYTAGGTFVRLRPGASFFDSVTSFEMVRGGKLTAVLLGAYQVDEEGSLANWTNPAMVGGGIGGAMDLVAGNLRVIVLMEHCESKGGTAKLVRKCTYPVTGLGCVDTVVTDLALLKRRDGEFWLEEIAPGFSVEEVRALTAMRVRVPDRVDVLRGASA